MQRVALAKCNAGNGELYVISKQKIFVRHEKCLFQERFEMTKRSLMYSSLKLAAGKFNSHL